jgi:hypothetical protein
MPPTTQRPDCHVTQEAHSLITVPGKGNPRRTVRVDDEAWARFGEAAEDLGSERATLLRSFIDLVLGLPGGEAARRAIPDSDEGRQP